MEPTQNRIRGVSAEIQQAACKHRASLTPAEHVLWQALKLRQLQGLKFRCQHPVGRFIVDFYCPQHKLVIEIDGGVHLTQLTRDAARTSILNNYGYRVIRFSNEKVLSDLASVLVHIIEITDSPPPTLG